MQRNIVGSDLIKHLQLGTIGSLDKEPQSGQSDNFAHGNNLPPLGLAGLAAAAGLAGLPLSSAGIPPLNSSVPTIAALLAASQEKLAADIRHNINGLEKDHDEHQGMQLPKDYFDIKDDLESKCCKLLLFLKKRIEFETKSGIQGVGLSADICLNYHINDLNTISFEVDDVNGFYLFDNQEIQIDTSFNFNGVSIDVFNAETSVANYLDSSFTETINRNKTTQNQAFLPTKMKLQWVYKLNPRATLASSVESLSLGKFGTYLETAIIYTHNRQLMTRTSFGYGDFRRPDAFASGDIND